MGLQREVWLAEIETRLRAGLDLLSPMRDYSAFIENNAINTAGIGGAPAVVVNNNFATNPLTPSARVDSAINVPMVRFDTQPTLIYATEQHGLPYGKLQNVMEDHADELAQTCVKWGLHAVAPALATGKPVVMTTGDSDGGANARKVITRNDINDLARQFDELAIPREDRYLYLHPRHLQQLAQEDKALFNAIVDPRLLQIPMVGGFIVRVSLHNPLYFADTAASNVITRKAFGAAAAPTTDLIASVAFHAKRVMKAQGQVKMSYFEEERDVKTKADSISASVYFAASPLSGIGHGAIVSDVYTAPTP